MFKRFKAYLRLTIFLMGQSVLRAMEYRAAFLSQVLGMCINNCCWLGCWYLFFLNFPEVNGWRFKDSALLMGFSCVSAGVMIAFFWGSFELSRIIYRGELDYYLGFPKNILWHVSISNGRMSGIGDISSGLLMCLFVQDFSFLGATLFVYLCLISALALWGFTVLTRSISFFVGSFEGAADELFWSIITFGLYPAGAIHGILKLLISTVIPAIFIFILPVEIIRNFSWIDLGIVTAVSFALAGLGILTFNMGLRRYESGNLVQIRL